jgi:hypothetical protein
MTRPTHPCDCGQVQIREGEFAVYDNAMHTLEDCETSADHLADRRAVFGSYAEEALRGEGS